MNAALSLAPLLRNSVGFDRFSGLFESVLNTDKGADRYPPYNIEKLDENSYLITLAVAGFQRENLSVTVQNDLLTVKGKLESKDRGDVEYLHRGIAAQSFERSFHLAEYMQVTSANLHNGLLSIKLTREIPEEARARRIPIRTGDEDSPKAVKTQS